MLYCASLIFESGRTLGDFSETDSLPSNQVTLPTDENIRILIKNDNYEDIFHSSITLTSETGMNISSGEKSLEYASGEEFTVTKDMSYTQITASAIDGGKIHIKNLKRNSDAKYGGILELVFSDEGIAVINELSIEDYLCGVIPSEMPSTYPLEALKAQAVSARTYTYFHMADYAYPEWYAHMDDSTTYQVYMNNAPDEKSSQAVTETKGKVLTYNGEIVESFYYSTSGGCNGALAVWNNTSLSESLNKGYLVETGNEIYAANTIEGENAYKEYIDTGNPDDVEYSEAWYRWTYDRTISGSDVQSLLKFIYFQSLSQPENVEIISETKQCENIIYETLVSDIQIISRQKSGLVTSLTINTPNYQINIQSQYTIRLILGSLGGTVTRKDSSEYTINSILPSAYFYIEYYPSADNSRLVIHGAGFGHGCGMSQNGAKILAMDGFSYEEILKYYYNAEIEEY